LKLSLPPKLLEKLVWVQVIWFYKILFPARHLISWYAETGRSRRPDRPTLQVTLISKGKNATKRQVPGGLPKCERFISISLKVPSLL